MKKNIIICIIVILIILLFPFRRAQYNDGGTRTYSALLYKIIVWNRINDNYESGYKTGTDVHLFPNNFHELDYYVVEEPYALYVKTDNMDSAVVANRGSYCWNGSNSNTCVDTIGPVEMAYKNVLEVTPGEKINILNDNVKISGLEVWTLDNVSATNHAIDFDSNYIIVPNLIGKYIIFINTKYDEGNVWYSIMININEKDL